MYRCELVPGRSPTTCYFGIWSQFFARRKSRNIRTFVLFLRDIDSYIAPIPNSSAPDTTMASLNPFRRSASDSSCATNFSRLDAEMAKSEMNRTSEISTKPGLNFGSEITFRLCSRSSSSVNLSDAVVNTTPKSSSMEYVIGIFVVSTAPAYPAFYGKRKQDTIARNPVKPVSTSTSSRDCLGSVAAPPTDSSLTAASEGEAATARPGFGSFPPNARFHPKQSFKQPKVRDSDRQQSATTRRTPDAFTTDHLRYPGESPASD